MPKSSSAIQNEKLAKLRYNRSRYESGRSPATRADAGQAGEFLVVADCLARGLRCTKPLNTNGSDDLYVRAAEVGWLSLQVKTGFRSKRTGNILTRFKSPRSHISSDLIAVVHMPTKQIRYIPNKKPVPWELLSDLTILYGGGASSQSSSSKSVPVARRYTSASSGAPPAVSRSARKSTIAAAVVR